MGGEKGARGGRSQKEDAAGRHTPARSPSEASKASQPPSLATKYELALNLRKQGRPCEAGEQLRQCLLQAPEDSDVLHAAGLASRACEQASAAEARAYLRAALEQSPERTDSMSLLHDLTTHEPRARASLADETEETTTLAAWGQADAATLTVTVPVSLPSKEKCLGEETMRGREWISRAIELFRLYGVVRIANVLTTDVAASLAHHMKQLAKQKDVRSSLVHTSDRPPLLNPQP